MYGELQMNLLTGCYLYWYCGRDCQVDHWPKHQKDCKVIGRNFHILHIYDSQSFLRVLNKSILITKRKERIIKLDRFTFVYANSDLDAFRFF